MSNVIPFPGKRPSDYSEKDNQEYFARLRAKCQELNKEKAIVPQLGDEHPVNQALARIESLTDRIKRGIHNDNIIPNTADIDSAPDLEKRNEEFFAQRQKRLEELRQENNKRTTSQYRLRRKPPTSTK